jgi:beta-aspartyl-peptidase (threonine type)
MPQKKISLAIHGGAGLLKPSDYSEIELKNYFKGLQKSLIQGHKVLQGGGSALNAVASSVKELENCPLFNAGTGGVFAENEIVELDASIMDGKNLTAGAVTCVHRIKNPIVAALKVMENSPHVLLSGNGAEIFAFDQGLELVPNEFFHTPKRKHQLEKAKEKKKISLNHSFGTVGAVAMDKDGYLCAGTSTGGLVNKLYGRVSDSSMIGAGNYANNLTCAISGTGTGDNFIRTVLAYDFSCLMEYKDFSMEEASKIVLEKLKKSGGHGGLIAIDKTGKVHMDFNSTGMFRAFVDKDEFYFGAFDALIKGDSL